MGSDDFVVDTARVSFNKQAVHYTKEENKKLINYLAKHGHWSPFSHCYVSFRIKAPLFVARQLGKSSVGFSWNEISRRYVDEEPEFYFPEVWRGRSVNAKQGSDGVIKFPLEPDGFNHDMWFEEVVSSSLNCYNGLLESGVAPEQARMILPQNTMTEWIWTGSLYAFARVCKQRLDPHSQKETRDVAELISKQLLKLFPYSWEVLSNQNSN